MGQSTRSRLGGRGYYGTGQCACDFLDWDCVGGVFGFGTGYEIEY